MNTWTISRRIIFGYAAMILLALVLGALALWRIVDINREITLLSTNTVPSVVTLNQINTSIAKAGRASRRCLMLTAEADKKTAEAAYQAAQASSHQLSDDYALLLSDDEDRRLFTEVQSAMAVLFTAADTFTVMSRENTRGKAEAYLTSEVDPSLEACIQALEKSIAYNTKLSKESAATAETIVLNSFLVISTALGLVLLLGTLIGWATVRSTNRELGTISDALERGATQTSTASGQLSSSSQVLAEGSSEQGSSVAETSASLEEMSAMISSTADNAERAKSFANQARTAAQSGSQTMAEMNTAMRAIESSSAEVSKIVKNIDEIAFQTNILALNAAVEAARAGEVGAGFAVVADEVRSLAQRSAAAAKETAEKIETAIANSRRGSISCSKVGESLDEIVQKVSAADALVAEISTAAKEQSLGIQQIGVAMTQMDKITQTNAASAADTATAAEQLSTQAISMQEIVVHLRSLVGGRKISAPAGELSGIANSRRVGRASKPAAALPRATLRSGGRGRGIDSRRAAVQIPMPELGVSEIDQEDRNFKNF